MNELKKETLEEVGILKITWLNPHKQSSIALEDDLDSRSKEPSCGCISYDCRSDDTCKCNKCLIDLF